MQDKKKIYHKYLKEIGVRKVSEIVFRQYLTKYGSYKKTIEELKKPKRTGNNKTGTTKVKNIKEIVEYAKVFSVEKAAKEYGVSERTVHRYRKMV